MEMAGQGRAGGLTVNGTTYLDMDNEDGTWYELTQRNYDTLRWNGQPLEALGAWAKGEMATEEDAVKLGELKKIGWCRIVACDYYGLSFFFLFEDRSHRQGDVVVDVQADFDGNIYEVTGWDQPFQDPSHRMKKRGFRWIWERAPSVEHIEALLKDTPV